jgi:hypothetical protein
LRTTVNLNASSTTGSWVAWARTFSSSGRHVVKIVCRGTSGHARVDIDAFEVIR